MRVNPRDEPRARIRWPRILISAAAVGVLSALAPAILAAIQAGAGLLALAGMLLCGWAGLLALPYLGQRLENRLLRAQLREARVNPIEELLRQLIARSAQLERYRDALAAVAAEIDGMRDLLEERRRTAPHHDTHKQAAALERMRAFHAHHERQLAAAESALEGYERHLTQKRFEWNFAQAGKQVLSSLHAPGREGILRELLGDEASSAVQASFNRVFATLDVELCRLEQREPTGPLLPPPSQGRP